MATIGRGILRSEVFDLFDAMRSYDVPRAAKALAADADWESPYAERFLTGRPAIEAHLKQWLGDAKTRPSLTMQDVSGDGNVARLRVSVSNRFGRAPDSMTMHVLALNGTVHHVKFVKDAPARHH